MRSPTMKRRDSSGRSVRHSHRYRLLPRLDQIDLARLAAMAVGKRRVLEEPDDLSPVAVVGPGVAAAVGMDEAVDHAILDLPELLNDLTSLMSRRLVGGTGQLRAVEEVPVQDPGRAAGDVLPEMLLEAP